MSPASLKLPVILCLCWAALATEPKVNKVVQGVQWKETGDSVTIQCRSHDAQDNLYLKLGLNENIPVFHRNKRTGKDVISSQFTRRLQTSEAGQSLNIDIVIRNVFPNDTGPYWCIYNKYDPVQYQQKTTRGNGSVLLVVNDKRGEKDEATKCPRESQDIILVSLVVIGVMLFLVIAVFLVKVFRKLRSRRTPKKPGQVGTSDVYEDMRATIRG